MFTSCLFKVHLHHVIWIVSALMIVVMTLTCSKGSFTRNVWACDGASTSRSNFNIYICKGKSILCLCVGFSIRTFMEMQTFCLSLRPFTWYDSDCNFYCIGLLYGLFEIQYRCSQRMSLNSIQLIRCNSNNRHNNNLLKVRQKSNTSVVWK